MNIGTTYIAPVDSRDLQGLLSQEERRRLFRQARRHTFVIKTLKLLLPLASLAIIGLYFIPKGAIEITKHLPGTIDSINLSSGGLKMINPRYKGNNPKVGSYVVEADYALQRIDATNVLNLHTVRGNLEHPDKNWTKLTANNGIYDTKTEQLQLEGNIHITSNRGMEAKLRHADIDIRAQRVQSSQPVFMRMNRNTINAAAMDLTMADNRVLFTGGVKVLLYKNSEGNDQAPAAGNSQRATE